MILLGNGETLGWERVKRRLELVQDDAEGWRKKKDSETKDKAARLAAEAVIFEKGQNEDHDPDAVPNGLFDFADESLEFEQSAAVVGDLPISPTPLTGISHEAEVNHGTVLSNNVLSPSSLSSFLRGQNIEKPALQYFSSVSWKLLLRRLYSNSHPPNLHYCVFTTTLQLTTNKLNPNSSSHFLLYSMIGQLISMCNNQN